MNKYQEALDIIKRDYAYNEVSKKEFPTFEEVENAIKDLQELVDKGTAVKPILQSNLDWKCPKCGAYHTKFVQYYCEFCGKKIDWSEE